MNNENKIHISNSQGFTLIEIVVAMIILGLAYVAVLQNFSVSMKNITKIDLSRTEVVNEVMEFDALLNQDEEEIVGNNFPQFLEG